LSPLGRNDLAELLADALYTEPRNVGPLTELVAAKTGGNPYFTGELLKDLYRQELIRYDMTASSWTCDLDRIAHASLTDNVVELMTANLSRLSLPAQEMLRAAACIGHPLELGTLLAVCGNHWEALFRALDEVM